MTRSNLTPEFDIPYPIATDNVNIHQDLADIASRLDVILPNLGIKFFDIQVTNNTGSLIPKATPVYFSGYVDGKPTIAKTVSTNPDTFPVAGITKTLIPDDESGVVITSGIITGLNTSSFSNLDVLYVSDSGTLTNIQPTAASSAIAYVVYSHTTDGIIMLGQPKGDGTWGALRKGMA